MNTFTTKTMVDVVGVCKYFLHSNSNDVHKAKQALARSIASAPGISQRSFVYKYFSKAIDIIAERLEEG